jgi:hypothetical protein
MNCGSSLNKLINYKQMASKCRSLLALFALLAAGLRLPAQQKHFVEEIAFYHLTNLQEIDKSLKDVSFFTSGALRSDTTGALDTLLVKTRDTLFVPNPFPGAAMTEQKDLAQFEVPVHLRGKKKARPLQVKHYLKSGSRYFVHFSCFVNEFEGVIIVVVLNSKGDLTHYKVAPFAR